MSYPTTIGRGRSGPVAAMSLTLLLLAGCTSVSVDREVGAMEQLPPPDRVLLYNFAVTPQEVPSAPRSSRPSVETMPP